MKLFLLRAFASLLTGRGRRDLSKRLFAAGERRHWYFVTHDWCPVCGEGYDYRERVYGPRPPSWLDRHGQEEHYDGCEGY